MRKIRIDIRENNTRTMLDKQFSAGAADPTRGPGDDCDFSF
jgi:hypothetical protein